MRDPMLLALVIVYAGFTALCLAMPKHGHRVFGRDPSTWRRSMLRVLGGLGLAAGLAASLSASGWRIGTVAWVGSLSIAALALVFLLAYAPRAAAALALGAPLVATVAALLR